MFRKGHIYLDKFQESFFRLSDTDFQMMETEKGTRQTVARVQTDQPERATSRRSVHLAKCRKGTRGEMG